MQVSAMWFLSALIMMSTDELAFALNVLDFVFMDDGKNKNLCEWATTTEQWAQDNEIGEKTVLLHGFVVRLSSGEWHIIVTNYVLHKTQII